MKRSPTDWEELYEDGDLIVRQGDESRELFLIQQGSAVVTKQLSGVEIELGRLQRGEFFGEMALLESMPRTADVRAVGRTKVLVIHPGGLLLKIRRNPTFALELLQQMSCRVREMSDRLAGLLNSEILSDEAAEHVRDLLHGLDSRFASEDRP